MTSTLRISEIPSPKQGKALQSIVSLSCHADIIEGDTTSTKILTETFELKYFGDDENPDIKSKVDSFLEGDGRFRHFWNDDMTKVHPDFDNTVVGGLSHRQIKLSSVLTMMTQTQKKKLGKRFRNHVDRVNQFAHLTIIISID